MSAWILGSEVAGPLGLRDFEFVQEYVAKGLAPYNHEGQIYMPAAVVDQFIKGLEQELSHHDEIAWDLGGSEREWGVVQRPPQLADMPELFWF